MNWKLIILGGLAFYVTMFIVSLPGGMLIHEGVLDATYRATTEFWRPELTQDPPDMASLMPRWITVGLLMSFVQAALYGWIRGGFSGAPWQKGMKFGALLAVVGCTMMAGWSGVFNLPGNLWMWWGIESFIYFLAGGAVLGWVGQKLAPEGG